MSSKRRNPPSGPIRHTTAAQRKQTQSLRHTQEDEPAVPPIPVTKIGENDRIGDILRRVREHREEDLEAISEYLRIRPDYLFALENSRYDQLPADAYVIGFLRTYAAYLGLDGRGAIDQYRREMAGRRRKPQLSMPQPMPEGRAPTVVIMAAAAFAALIVFGIWYGLSTPDEDAARQPLPISEIIEEPKTDAGAIALSAPSAPEPVALTPTEPAAIATEAPKAEEKKAEEKKPEAVKPEDKKKEATPAPEAPKVEEKKPEEKKIEEKKPEEKKVEEKKAETPKVDPNKIEVVKIEALPVTVPKVEDKKAEAAPAQAEAPTDASKPQVFGEKDKTRVTVRADKDSWVLVTDSKGVTVFERTLKAGEIYNVPNGRNLNLTTGNVAGVSLMIDGANMPRLPATGKVARGVPLDPDKLRSRLTAPLPVKQPAEQQPKSVDSTESSD